MAQVEDWYSVENWEARNWENRVKLAIDLCQRNGYCGRVLAEYICVKVERHTDDCAFRTKIKSVIPF